MTAISLPRCRGALAFVAMAAGLAPALAAAQAAADLPSPPAVQREFRAAWVATVGNMDWPSQPGLSTADQQRQLTAILDRAVALHLNAIIFQVRPGADAFYRSEIEPWSEYLTGRMGRAPKPAWDPLAFAITEAHRRGLELHAWFNPFRARYAHPLSVASQSHVTKTTPRLVRQYGPFKWLDPGELLEVRRRARRVVLDVVNRYDVDGVHIDDYFYPYQEHDRSGRTIDFPDGRTYKRYRQAGGSLSRADWRRHNVDLFIESLYKAVKDVKPWVQVGVSPIGIWRPNHPAGITGIDAYEEIFADSRKWLQEGWVDYFVPQLYWAIDSPQSYPQLLTWWVEQNVKGRHVYAGNGLYRVRGTDSAAIDGSRSPWSAGEMVNQVRITRQTAGAQGNVFFSMTGLMQDVDSVTDKLGALYTDPALVPASPWLRKTPPRRPMVSVKTDATGLRTIHVAPAAADADRVRLWVVQSHRRAAAGATSADSVEATGYWTTEIVPASQRIIRLAPIDTASAVDAVFVTAVDRAGNESEAGVARIAPALAGKPAER